MNSEFLFDMSEIPKIANPMARKYGLGPEGKQCKTCAHLVCIRPGQNRYYKCEMRGITHGPGTDHRVGWEACVMYREKED
jgi:hypothetical protein